MHVAIPWMATALYCIFDCLVGRLLRLSISGAAADRYGW